VFTNRWVMPPPIKKVGGSALVSLSSPPKIKIKLARNFVKSIAVSIHKISSTTDADRWLKDYFKISCRTTEAS